MASKTSVPHHVAAVMAQLEALGSEQTRRTWRRHGATGPAFGVKFGDLGKLAKAIGTDHQLALALWGTGNVDARQLACMVADPAQADEKLLEAWAKELDWYGIADCFAKYVARSPFAATQAKDWIDRNHEWTEEAGWVIWAWRFMEDPTVTDAEVQRMLKRIERDMHGAKNRVRYAMNNALIAIGMRSDALEREALAVARRIGTVEVDHGETGCKTPDAVAYIPKARAHRKAKAARAKPR